jgi:GxxExxY protein
MGVMITKGFLNDLTYEVIGAAINVHKEMGKGLLESVYHACMKEELNHKHIKFQTELKVPVSYKTKQLDVDLRCDLLIEDCLVTELKAVNEFHRMFDAQVLSYMKLLKVPKGIIINFNCHNIFNDGQKTFVNEYFQVLQD